MHANDKIKTNNRTQKGEKHILIGINNGFTARYFLQTDIINRMLEGPARILIIAAQDGSYLDEYRNHNKVSIQIIPDEWCEDYYNENPHFQWLFRVVRLYVYGKRNTTRDIFMDYYITDTNKRLESASLKEKIDIKARRLVVLTISRLLQHSHVLRKVWLWLECRLYTPNIYEKILKEFNPHTVVVSSLGTFDWDQYLMREARRVGATIVTVVLSWDNSSTRGYPGALPDKVVTWTSIMKKELEDYHDIPDYQTYVGGVASFDHYFKSDPTYSRINTLESIGADHTKNIVFFTTKSPNSYPWNPNIARAVLSAIKDGRLTNCQLLLRVHPLHYRKVDGEYIFQNVLDSYEELLESYRKNLILNKPVLASEKLNYAMPRDEVLLLSRLIKSSSVIVNIFSTLNIEASILDKPLVNVCFEGKNIEYEAKGKARFNVLSDFSATHNQRIVDSGGIQIAYNENQLIGKISAYLNDPNVDSVGRKAIVQQEAGPNRGRAGIAIADYIASL